MTKPDPAPQPLDEPIDPAVEKSVAEEAEIVAEEPAPEPWVWTPERVADWNAYYDLYVVGLVVVLVFIASATPITNSTIWTLLQSGRLTAEQGSPVVKEPFLYAKQGRPWANVSWLYQWASYQVYALVGGLDIPRPDQYAAGVLTGLNALVRAMTALMLVCIRRRGPGAWWAAVTTGLALGIVLDPFGLTLGGIASRPAMAPETWGIFLLAVEMLLLHRAFNEGRRRALYGLIPLFVFWSNVDESFASGLVLLVAMVVGEVSGGRRVLKADGVDAPAWKTAIAVTGLCLAACLVNPTFHRAFVAGFRPLIESATGSSALQTRDQLSIFGSKSRDFFEDVHPKIVGYFALLVALGFGSFLLNAKRFRPGRFAAFLVAAVLWALLYRLRDVFAVVWAATVALNGQEWYQDAFGSDPKLGWRWRLWSVGGRVVTLGLVILAILKGMTGYGNQYLEPAFGFGYDPDEFAFEAADFLKTAPLRGEVYNLKLGQGDALNWRAYPLRKPFLDTRRLADNGPLLDELETVGKALAQGDSRVWKPILDERGVTVVMVEPRVSESNRPSVSQALSADPDWIAFYDDGDTLMFGRADDDAPAEDLAFFRANRLSAEVLAFRVDRPVRTYNRPPSPVGMLDRVFQARALAATQPRVKAAQRWLQREQITDPDGSLGPSIAACFLAIQEARNALSSKPDDTDAYYILSLAYRRLGDLEYRLLMEANGGTPPAGDVPPTLRVRLQQRMTALNYAIQTAPKPPKTEYARETLRNMYFELAGLYQGQGYLDLARDALAEAIKLTPSDDLEPAAQESLDQLTEQLEQVRADLEEAELEGQAQPEQIAVAAVQRGAPGLAIQKLEDAEASGIDLPTVKWRLVDLLCDTGQPDRALPYLDNIGNDPNLATGPGTDSFRQARVYFLLGDHKTAAQLWGPVSIEALRGARANAAIQSALMLLRGDPANATRVAMDVPNQLAQQAEWEYILGLALLEGGRPTEGGEHLRLALELNAKLSGRPIAVEYLGKMGLEVPAEAVGEAASDSDEPPTVEAGALDLR